MAGASLGLSHEIETNYYSPYSSSFPPFAAAMADFGGATHRSFDDYSLYSDSVVPPFASGNELMMTGMYANTTGGEDAARGGRSAAGRIGFRTRSEVEVMEDGFKWRKYGKKAVKSSPNPRNYYRCSSEGCGVKKRVERDADDPSYVLTSYDGVHNHAAPGAEYPPTAPAAASSAYSASSPLSTNWTWSEPATTTTSRLLAAGVEPWAAQSSESTY